MSDTRKPNHHKFIFDVRFEEKEVAKLSGLKWDATIKKWYQWVESQSEIMKQVLNKIEPIPFKVDDIISPYYDDQPDQKDLLIKASIKHYKSIKNYLNSINTEKNIIL